MSLVSLGIEENILEAVEKLETASKLANTSRINGQNIYDNNIRSAITQLVPDDVYHIVENLSSAFEMWNAIKMYYQPNVDCAIETMMEDFYGFTIDEDVDVDELANELTRRQTQIASINPSRMPPDSSKRSRLLKHFEKIGNGVYGGSVSYLKTNPSVTFLQAVNLIRDSQENYRA